MPEWVLVFFQSIFSCMFFFLWQIDFAWFGERTCDQCPYCRECHNCDKCWCGQVWELRDITTDKNRYYTFLHPILCQEVEITIVTNHISEYTKLKIYAYLYNTIGKQLAVLTFLLALASRLAHTHTHFISLARAISLPSSVGVYFSISRLFVLLTRNLKLLFIHRHWNITCNATICSFFLLFWFDAAKFLLC